MTIRLVPRLVLPSIVALAAPGALIGAQTMAFDNAYAVNRFAQTQSIFTARQGDPVDFTQYRLAPVHDADTRGFAQSASVSAKASQAGAPVAADQDGSSDYPGNLSGVSSLAGRRNGRMRIRVERLYDSGREGDQGSVVITTPMSVFRTSIGEASGAEFAAPVALDVGTLNDSFVFPDCDVALSSKCPINNPGTAPTVPTTPVVTSPSGPGNGTGGTVTAPVQVPSGGTNPNVGTVTPITPATPAQPTPGSVGQPGFVPVVPLDVVATPEPATLVLVASGLAGVFGITRRRRRAPK